MKVLHKYLIVQLLVLLIIFNLCCGRTDPIANNNNISVPTLQPLFVFNINISEPSGIAYNSKNNTLMIVSDGNSDIYETDLSGNELRTIPTTSSDMEGITLTKNCDTIFVVEETNRLVISYLESGVRLNSFSVDVAATSNHALEGITRNNANGHLFVINEKQPCMLLEFNGTTELWRRELKYTSDVSDVYFEAPSSSLWIVSDESKKILKLSNNTNLMGEWMIPVHQGEGITIINDKIYIVSDVESKLYVFQKP